MLNPTPLSNVELRAPVDTLDAGQTSAAQPGIALCLSGGGYRAMVFHVGTLWRLNELGYLPKLDRISSVSGGSIAAAVLGLKWPKLIFNGEGVGANFVTEVVAPIRGLASKTIDSKSILTGALGPGSIPAKVIKAYRKHLFDTHTLQDLPDKPRFVFNATNVQSGALWRFAKPYMRDYRVGEVKNPDLELAVAVAASSAFPPFLSPVELKLDESSFTLNTGKDLQRKPFTTNVVLTDGGVYDNLGLETAWKRYDTILVSDAGGKARPEDEPKGDWARHTFRVLGVIDNQVRSLRKRQLMASYANNDRKGAYWGIRTDIADYGLDDALDCAHTKTLELANVPTRLKRLTALNQKQLINWGYAVCDAAIRRYVDPTLTAPSGFPYPDVGVA